MSKLTIKSNYLKREILYWNNLTFVEKKEFDYLNKNEDCINTSFVRYRGQVYNIDDFEKIVGQNSPLENWDGYKAETYFSGVCIKLCKDGDFVIMGHYYS